QINPLLVNETISNRSTLSELLFPSVNETMHHVVEMLNNGELPKPISTKLGQVTADQPDILEKSYYQTVRETSPNPYIYKYTDDTTVVTNNTIPMKFEKEQYNQTLPSISHTKTTEVIDLTKDDDDDLVDTTLQQAQPLYPEIQTSYQIPEYQIPLTMWGQIQSQTNIMIPNPVGYYIPNEISHQRLPNIQSNITVIDPEEPPYET